MLWHRYEEYPVVLAKALSALASLTKDANKKVQDKAHNVMHPLNAAIRALMKPGLETFMTLTRNHKENTKIAMRGGGKAEWLAEDSEIRVDDNGRVVD